MTTWESYPAEYRRREVQHIVQAIHAGECFALLGLSGSGKSNLLGFLAARQDLLTAIMPECPHMVLVDCNRLTGSKAGDLFHLMSSAIEPSTPPEKPSDAFTTLEAQVTAYLERNRTLCFLIDRFENISGREQDDEFQALHSNLRALRDSHKYALTYVTASRHPLQANNELAELFFSNTCWLGALSPEDADWSVRTFCHRHHLDWDSSDKDRIIYLSGGYPSLLRAVCEAYASGAALELASLQEHPAVRHRVDEFWADHPTQNIIELCGLTDNPLLKISHPHTAIDTNALSAKEYLLWQHLTAHPNQVCDKDDLVRAIWPEDRIYEQGIRDDSLAQLVRRLREKIEPDPSAPQYIHTIPGRGYRYIPK